MHVDLLTLYFLAIGTLFVSAAMTLWERRANPQRRSELGSFAAGFAVLAVGCIIAMCRGTLPVALGLAVSNLVIVAGYLVILDGVAALGGRQYRGASLGLLVALAAAWAVVGPRWPEATWNHLGSLPIALISAATCRAMLRNVGARALRSQRVVVLATGIHAIFYAGRCFLLPVVTAVFGQDLLAVVGKVTLYEGVLYSVCLPMALLALIREEAYRRLLDASRTDFLTGLGNRQWFFEEGARLLRARDGQAPLSLLAFDLDHFKAINDRYGHAAGDEVLKAFARSTRGVVGPDVVLARIGGEEFAALLPGHDGGHARDLGQAVARRFAATVARGDDGVGVKTTVSVGLAEYDAGTPDLDGLLAAADRALYVAKALGRNRVEMAPPLALPAVA